ncbi:polysaccharide pyruvyl transferase family protein [Corynebacterium casei]|uniref:polysaccharide pyruvyl transferase family protein n=1 Tax=Corynebacterium casei TaxID=160386 RepID=UPI003FD5D67C
MSQYAPKIGIIGLGEAGNLGDDLILIATIDAVYEALPEAEVSYLSHGQKLDWSALGKSRGYPRVPIGIPQQFEIPFIRQNNRSFSDRDVVIFGGGGLLQTSHSSIRPYTWLSYLPESGKGNPRIVATGLGLGPISDKWLRKLKAMGTPFDKAWVRDSNSVALARNDLGWTVEQCRDFIDREFLRTIHTSEIKSQGADKSLGVALREWPGFSVEDAVRHIESIAKIENCEEVVFFVLESNQGTGMDVNFSRVIARKLALKTSMVVYQADELDEFISRMSSVDVAISMKLHSSAIWAMQDIPMYPIFYAPKVAALFGQEYKGFQIVDSKLIVPSESNGTPSAKSTILDELSNQIRSPESLGARFSALDRLRYQLIRLAISMKARIFNLVTNRKRAAK